MHEHNTIKILHTVATYVKKKTNNNKHINKDGNLPASQYAVICEI